MGNNLLDLKTSKELLAAIKEAGTKKLSAHDILEQRVSFVLGSIKSDVTREQVKQLILEQEGCPE